MTLQVAPGGDELTVLLEFDVEPEEQAPLRQALTGIIRDVLVRQPSLVSAQVLVSRDGRKVLTYLGWVSLDAFETFRDDEEKQRRIRAVLGSYGPQLRVCDIVLTVVGGEPSRVGPAPIP